MLTFLVIDQSLCAKELKAFIKQHNQAIKSVFTTKQVLGLAGGKSKKTMRSRIVVNTTDAWSVLHIDDIIHCESHRNYTLLHLTDNRQFMASKTLMEFETLLEGHHFVRIHKSHLINLNYLEKYVKAEGGYVVLSNGQQLPVSIRKKENLFKALEKL